MDIVMPGMNGYQATRALANDPKTRTIPDHHGDLQGPGDRPDLGPAPGRGRLHGEARLPRPARRKGPGDACRLRSRPDTDGRQSLSNPCGTGPSSCWPSSSGAAAPCRRRSARKPPPGANGSAWRCAWRASCIWSRARRRAKCSACRRALTRVPGAKSWIKGLANVRGQLLPVIDLRQFLGSGAHAADAQHAHRRGESPRDPGRPPGRRGARLPALRGRRVLRRCAADRGALRALSRGRVPPRRRAVAGTEPAPAAREPAFAEAAA